MKILIACEFSGIVRDAFKKRGHDAWSCDLIETEVPGQHIVDDVTKNLEGGWDMMIAHPPCQYLSSSGLHWNKRVPGRDALTNDAMRFVYQLLTAPIRKIALENPVGCISSKYRKPDQIIQPWQYGHDASKATCLWLKGLPLLRPTDVLSKPAWIRCDCCDDYLCTIHGTRKQPIHVADCPCLDIDAWALTGIDPYRAGGRGVYANQTPNGQNKLGPSPTRAKDRARTYTGIAVAMAEQWGG